MASQALAVMPASMWHMPEVWTWMEAAPRASMRLGVHVGASMSASMTAISKLPFRSRMIRDSRVVFPEPGLLMTFTSRVPASFIRRRRASASRSLEAVTDA